MWEGDVYTSLGKAQGEEHVVHCTSVGVSADPSFVRYISVFLFGDYPEQEQARPNTRRKTRWVGRRTSGLRAIMGSS